MPFPVVTETEYYTITRFFVPALAIAMTIVALSLHGISRSRKKPDAAMKRWNRVRANLPGRIFLSLTFLATGGLLLLYFIWEFSAPG